ncbi:hypothetical protein F2Q68_00031067 [Brassica cretica]|uniref:Uncharacterized protein n=1 Tax=Brassica cretica TaxID=69181 RepID=A0A8S9GH02_BRACR|nr:hypothetical protein F2Q68_00031067 [Brassica cretica]
MPVLLKSGQSAAREEVVEEMKDTRSMKQHWCRSKVRREEKNSFRVLLELHCKMKKIRGRRVCTRIDDGCATSIDRASLASVDRHLTVSIDRASRVLIAT